MADLSANPEGSPSDISAAVCATVPDRTACEVLLDVPAVCAGASPSCPLVFFFHGSGGKNDFFYRAWNPFSVTALLHAGGGGHGFIGVYPQGEQFPRAPSVGGTTSGWNTGLQLTPLPGPDELAYVQAIVAHLRALGCTGRLYAVGTSNGAALAHRIGANGGLGFSGIVPIAMPLTYAPTTYGPPPHNYNHPTRGSASRAIAVMMIYGSADTGVPIAGDPDLWGRGIRLMSAYQSLGLWAEAAGCTGGVTRSQYLASYAYPNNTHLTTTADGQRLAFSGCPAAAPVELLVTPCAGHSELRTIDGVGQGAGAAAASTSFMSAVLDFVRTVEAVCVAGASGWCDSPPVYDPPRPTTLPAYTPPACTDAPPDSCDCHLESTPPLPPVPPLSPPAPPSSPPGPISAPHAHSTTLYVDAAIGSDTNDGTSPQTALKTMRRAAALATSSTAIYVANGVYRNWGFGGGGVGAVARFADVDHILLSNLPGHSPQIEFDGAAGISCSTVSHFSIRGFTITGPSASITYADAYADRLLHSPYFSGRGIAIWGGHHIRIHNNTVRHAPNSCIRVDRGDHVTIEDNVVDHCTEWSSNAESAVVIAVAKSVDTSDDVKMVIRNNIVSNSRNFIPYYNSCYDDPQCIADHHLSQPRPGYGTIGQTFIMDGSGVYITRNSATYTHGAFELTGNTAFGNGINGLSVQKTNRVHVRHNVVYGNGATPKGAPELRQPYAGLTLNHAEVLTLENNSASTTLADDYAYVLLASTLAAPPPGAPPPLPNFVCNGMLDSRFAGKSATFEPCPPPSPPAEPPSGSLPAVCELTPAQENARCVCRYTWPGPPGPPSGFGLHCPESAE